MTLIVRLLGPIEISREDRPVEIAGFKPAALLAYLLVTGQPHSRRHLVDLLFDSPADPRAALRWTLSKLRQALGPEYIVADRQRIAFNLDADYWLDVTAFEAGQVDLYRGDFLEGVQARDAWRFEEWLIQEREQRRNQYQTALSQRLAAQESRADYAAVIETAHRLLRLDNLNEAWYRASMRAYTRLGRREMALAQYVRCRRVLAEELDLPPAAATTALYEQIRAGQLDRPAGDLAVEAADGREQAGPPALDPSPAAPPFLAGEDETGRPLFVARDREVRQLEAFLALALAGQGRGVFVVGEAGQGKTALVREFARRAQAVQADLIVAQGNCHAYTGTGVPYLPFREILELLIGNLEAGWTAGAIDRRQARRLWEFTPRSVQALLAEAPDLIDIFVSGPALAARAAGAARALSPELASDGAGSWLTRLEALAAQRQAGPPPANLQQSHLFEQYTRLLQALARQQPLLLLVDDLQWTDDGSLDLLFHLGRRLQGSRILLIGVYRSSEVALGRPASGPGRSKRHPLEPVVSEFQRRFGNIQIDLSQAEGNQFVEAFLDSEPNALGPEFRRALYHHTGGHPLFTIELWRTLRERGDLVQNGAGRWVAGPAVNWNALPARVEGVVGECLSRLPVKLQEVLKAASVEGENFTAEVVAQVQAVDMRRLVRQLSGQLDKQHRLVSALGTQRVGRQRLSRYRFRHNLFQKYLYNSLDEVERAYLHEDMGNVLEKLYENQTGQIAVQLARHFLEAGLDERALPYLIQAGDAAMRQYASAEAAAHYTRVLEIAQRCEISPASFRQVACNLGRALELKGAYDAAFAHYREMEAVAQTKADQALELAALMARTTLHATFTPFADPQQAVSLSERSLSLARRLGDPAAEAKILWNLMLVHLYDLGNPRQAVSYGEESLAIARTLDHIPPDEVPAGQARREQLALTLNDLAIAYLSLGRAPQARETTEEARRRLQALANQPMLAENYNGSIIIYLRLGDCAAALAAAAEGERISRAIDNRLGQITNLINISFVYLEQGQFGRIITALDDILPPAEQAGPFYAFGVHSAQALAYAGLGALEPALALTRQALTCAGEMAPVWQGWSQALLARLLIGQGDLPAAKALLQEDPAGLDEKNFMWLGGPQAPLAEAELGLAQGRYARTLAILDDHLAHLQQLGLRGCLPEPLYLKGQALLALDRLDEARQVLAAARAQAEVMTARRMMWPILAGLAAIETRRGNAVAAENLQAQARQIIAFIAGRAASPDLKALFLDRPQVQALIDASRPGGRLQE